MRSLEPNHRHDPLNLGSQQHQEPGSPDSRVAFTQSTFKQAKAFVLRKWRERAVEHGREEPTDLSGACKFVSLFAQKVFGGELRGNYHHQFVDLSGVILDLADDTTELIELRRKGIDPYLHDPHFWGNPEHEESLASCEARASDWAQEFIDGQAPDGPGPRSHVAVPSDAQHALAVLPSQPTGVNVPGQAQRAVRAGRTPKKNG